MPKYKIGVTEAGDAGLDLSWYGKLERVNGAILITKQVTPEFCRLALMSRHKVIIHATMTGYGGTVLEPHVPAFQEELSAILDLVQSGFPQRNIVIRIDPIIPTDKGLQRAADVFIACMDAGFSRFRISVVDMYPHVRQRFAAHGLPLPYGERKYASGDQLDGVDELCLEMEQYWCQFCDRTTPLRIESCAEPFLKQAIPCGCVSSEDLSLLGLDGGAMSIGRYQREHCMCYSGKTELLAARHPCSHGCLYCYWKD